MSQPVLCTQTASWEVTTGAADQLGLGALLVNISHVGLQALAGGEGLLAETAGNQNVGMFRLFVFVQL